ncbi:MAG: glycoside hydrolase family 26 protein [Melioribacteraceae bacterium]|nr:glycoside hydrolase family 26 protein [Melioribacteraceae bacterium]
MFIRISKIGKVVLNLIIGIAIFWSCSDSPTESEEETPVITNTVLVDSIATKETLALFNNLRLLRGGNIMFGHQFTTAYGVGWKNDGFGNRSDVKDVCGDFPAVYGWDMGEIHTPNSIDGVPFSDMRILIRQAYERGGINTISVHLDNPVTGGTAWDNTTAVKYILPGGTHHESYMNTLSLIADYLESLKATSGEFIPIIFRPYHEHSQSWSWWGSGSTTISEFNQLWEMTVKYLRDERNLHHLIYCISPQDISSEADYLVRYPGDEWVDVLGLDYYKLYNSGNISDFETALETINRLADQRGKIAAVTEIGLENIPISNWWTDYLLEALAANSTTRKTSWALVWRNDNTGHHFAPYPGHSSANNFIQFYNSDYTIFESELINLYE